MAKAAEPGASNKTLEKVVKQLESVNAALEEQNARDDVLIGFSESSGILGKIARNEEARKQKQLEKDQKAGALAAKNSLTVAKHQDEDSHESKGNLTDIVRRVMPKQTSRKIKNTSQRYRTLDWTRSGKQQRSSR